MIIKIRKYFKKKYFSDVSPKIWDALLLTDYIQSTSNEDVFFFKREVKHTKIIDLLLDEDEIFLNFKKNTRNEIRRAKTYGFLIESINSLGDFSSFYNKNKKNKLNQEYFEKSYSINENIIITSINYNTHVLVMHSYLIDIQKGRARLMHSVTNEEIDDIKINKKIIGFANRYLHYKDILFFKEKNFVKYDLGGYAHETNNIKLEGINKFKDSFGGEMIAEYNYRSIFLILLNNVKKVLKDK